VTSCAGPRDRVPCVSSLKRHGPRAATETVNHRAIEPPSRITTPKDISVIVIYVSSVKVVSVPPSVSYLVSALSSAT